MVGTKIARVSAANLIPPMLVPKDCNTPKDVWVPSKADLGEEDLQVGMGMMPNIIKTSVLHSPDDKKVVPEFNTYTLTSYLKSLTTQASKNGQKKIRRV